MPGVTSEDLEKYLAYRPFDQHDTNFIKSSWSKGLYHGSDWYALIPKELFFPQFDKVMTHILNKPRVFVRLAVVKEEPSAIVGYSIYETDESRERDSLHWLFVKPMWRNQGIARTLVPPNVVQVTHMTKIGKSLLRKVPQVIFNPFDL